MQDSGVGFGVARSQDDETISTKFSYINKITFRSDRSRRTLVARIRRTHSRAAPGWGDSVAHAPSGQAPFGRFAHSGAGCPNLHVCLSL